MSTDLGSLSTFAATAHPPDAALRVAQLSALDWMAVGLAGTDEPVAVHMRSLIDAEGARGPAHAFGLLPGQPARTAAWLNGVTAHALDYDDTHFAHIGHPTVTVLSAALAMGEALSVPVSRVLGAALVGMELSVRLGLWLGRDHYQVGFHQTATAGAFGATAAAGRLLALTPQQMAQALGLAATQASGLKAQFGTMGKPYNAGLAARCGVECAQLIGLGMTAAPDALDGPLGFGATHHGAGDLDAALDGLGEDWRFEQVSHKFHACCHGLHAALEAFRSLDLAGPEVAAMTIQTHPRWMSVCNQPAPTTGLGAKFSYRVALAMAAAGYDTARLDSYSDTTCADPRVVFLRDRIEVREAPDLSETQARLDVTLKNGTKCSATHDLDAPHPIEHRAARVQDKVAALIGIETVSEVLDLFDSDAPAAALGALMAQTAPASAG